MSAPQGEARLLTGPGAPGASCPAASPAGTLHHWPAAMQPDDCNSPYRHTETIQLSAVAPYRAPENAHICIDLLRMSEGLPGEKMQQDAAMDWLV